MDLKHYGIKGMKWGVRRFQNDDGTLTAKGRQRYGEDRYKDHGDGRIEIQKGAELQRIIMDNKYSRQNLDGMTYASVRKSDNNAYMTMFGKPGESRVLKLTAKTELKSPSVDEAASIFFKLAKENPTVMKEYKDAMYIPDEKQFQKEVDQILKGNTSKNQNLYERYFYLNHLLVYDEYMPNAKQMYFNELKKNGYNMLRDDYDYYTSGGNASSVILLDGSSSLKIKTDQLVTKSMVKKADKYCEMYAKKGEEYARRFGI